MGQFLFFDSINWDTKKNLHNQGSGTKKFVPQERVEKFVQSQGTPTVYKSRYRLR